MDQATSAKWHRWIGVLPPHQQENDTECVQDTKYKVEVEANDGSMQQLDIGRCTVTLHADNVHHMQTKGSLIKTMLSL